MKLFISITYICLSFITVAVSNSQTEKLRVLLEPKTIKAEDTLNLITFYMENFSEDTLITLIEPLRIDIIDSSYWIYLETFHSEFQIPLLYIINIPRRYDCVLGKIPVFFSNFPDLIKINPKQLIKVNVNLNESQKVRLRNKMWELSSNIRYVEKNLLDSAAKTFDEEIQNVYSLSIINKNEYLINKSYEPEKGWRYKSDSYNSTILEFLKYINKDSFFQYWHDLKEK